MALIQSGDSSDKWKIDPSKAGRVTLYDASGNPIDSAHPLAAQLAPGAVITEDLKTVNSTTQTARDWSLDFAKLQNMDLALTALRDALRGGNSKTLSDLVTALTTVGLATGSNTIGKIDQGNGGTVAWKTDGSSVTQPVSGSVSVSNLPSTQTVSGNVIVSNFPSTQNVAVLDSGATNINPAYDGSYGLPIQIVPTTVTAGTVYWQMRNAGAKRVFIRKIELILGWVTTTAAATRSVLSMRRATGSNTPGGTAITPIKKSSTMPASSVTGAFAPAGLTITGLTQEADFSVFGTGNNAGQSQSFDLDFTSGGETARFVLQPGESLLFESQALAVVAGFHALGQVTWDER